MGVSASGKSTIGRQLAERLGVPFVEGDDFHPASNIARMKAGHPLDDAAREPWLRGLADWIRHSTRAGQGAVLSCSALKHEYRDLLRAAGPGVCFLYLALDRETARERISHRPGHFMPARLLDSQYDTLEPLRAEEPGVTIDASAGPGRVLELARAAVARCRQGPRG
ncbi:gluconokinase [Kitasatospora sp. NPDC050543]|uniref:gluconokinase n=1 Tax=Kitasatospora sp. NPDC050543 TaxID=3364054 RepID=UPI0037BD0F9D